MPVVSTLADEIISVVGDVVVARGIDDRCRWGCSVGNVGEAGVAAVAGELREVAGDGGDGAAGDLANHVVDRIGDVEIAGRIDGDAGGSI